MKGMRSWIGWIPIVVATAALAAPTAQARHAPDNAAAPPQAPAAAVDDRLGPKYVGVPNTSAPAAVQTVEVVRPRGFQWGDAMIGAGVTAFAIALLGAALLGVTRRRVPIYER